MDPKRRCPCHSRKQYRRCCAPLHQGRPAASPTALMRSRYAAYSLGLADYVIDTTDPEGPQWNQDRAAWQASIAAFHQGSRFTDLRILSSGEDSVHFRAGLEQQGQDVSFEEHSRFVQRDGRWLYHGALP